MLWASMCQSDSSPFRWPLSKPLQAIPQPRAKSSTKESLTRAPRLAQSGTIRHLSDTAFVTSARKCVPTRHLCLSWAPVPQPLCTAGLATCQPTAEPFCCFHSVPPCPPSLADITCQARWRTTWHCGTCHLFPWAAVKEGLKFEHIKWPVIAWGTWAPLHAFILDSDSGVLISYFGLRFCSFLPQSPVFA